MIRRLALGRSLRPSLFPSVQQAGFQRRFNSSIPQKAEKVIETVEHDIEKTADAASNLTESVLDKVAPIKTHIEQFPDHVTTHAPDTIGYFQSLDIVGSLWSLWPPDVYLNLLEHVHVYTGIPWWAAITVCGILVRGALFPFFVTSANEQGKMSAIKPQLTEVDEQLKTASNMQEMQMASFEKKKILKKYGISQLKLMYPIAFFPISLGIFFGIRRMCEIGGVQGLSTEGILWFQNLAAPDPYLGLQIITAALYQLSIRGGTETGASNLSPGMVKIMQWLPWISVPFLMKMPAALLLHFFVNGLLMVIQGRVLRNPACRKMLGIHEMVPMPKPAPGATTKKESVRDTIQNALEKRKRQAAMQQKEDEKNAELSKLAARRAEGVVLKRRK
ncbi:Mitochondrial inner membrane protein [Yarrowia sp. B02]|nr:Mitochondrial inner membrane protein [Yarrowia sp. B02]